MIEAMQQTNKYKLNKPEGDDPIAIAPLNENMDKIEAALTSGLDAKADAAANTAAHAALQQRVATLEVHKIAIGTYIGNGGEANNPQVINLGFTPQAFILQAHNQNCLLVVGQILSGSTVLIGCVNGGFSVSYSYNFYWNSRDTSYRYIAFA